MKLEESLLEQSDITQKTKSIMQDVNALNIMEKLRDINYLSIFFKMHDQPEKISQVNAVFNHYNKHILQSKYLYRRTTGKELENLLKYNSWNL